MPFDWQIRNAAAIGLHRVFIIAVFKAGRRNQCAEMEFQ